MDEDVVGKTECAESGKYMEVSCSESGSLTYRPVLVQYSGTYLCQPNSSKKNKGSEHGACNCILIVERTYKFTLPETNSKFAPENGCLEYFLVSF